MPDQPNVPGDLSDPSLTGPSLTGHSLTGHSLTGHSLTGRPLTRRLFLAGSAAAVSAFIVGCGDDEDAADATTAATDGGDGNGTSTTVEGGSGTTLPTGADGAATRTVESLQGTVELPVDPQRVLVTYDDALDHALALGLPVIAAPGERGSANADFAPYLPTELTAGISKITTYPEANVEEIAALRPDVIVDDYGAEFATTVQDVAPTFSYDPFTNGWRSGFRDLAAAFGLTDKAETVLGDLETRAAGIRDRLADELGPLKAMQAYAIGGSLYVAEDDNGAFALMDQDLGFIPADIVATAGGGDALSEESYGDIDADVIVLFTDPTDTVDSVAAITESPLWPSDARVLLISIGHAFSGPFSVASYYDIIESELLG